MEILHNTNYLIDEAIAIHKVSYEYIAIQTQIFFLAMQVALHITPVSKSLCWLAVVLIVLNYPKFIEDHFKCLIDLTID